MFDLLCIVGPTASGKTNLAVRLAAAFGGEIISADSRQVYRGMDIGTGKDLDEYVWEGKKIPYHLIDVVEAGYKYNVFEYQADFVKVWEDCRQRGVLPVLCGGSGLYVEAVLKGYKLLAVPVDEDLRASLAGLSLPFSKLMNGHVQLLHHFLIAQLSGQVQRQVFIFQTVINQIFGLHTTLQNPFHLLHHSLLQTGM